MIYCDSPGPSPKSRRSHPRVASVGGVGSRSEYLSKRVARCLVKISSRTRNLPLAWVPTPKHPRKPTAIKGDVSYTLCTAEVCYGTGKLSDRFRADTDSSTHCPYRRLCAAVLGSGSRPWVGNFLGHLGPQVANLLGPLGSYLLGAYLVPDNPVVCSANPSMGLRPVNTTLSA